MSYTTDLQETAVEKEEKEQIQPGEAPNTKTTLSNFFLFDLRSTPLLLKS
jgi:hypothetical protein